MRLTNRASAWRREFLRATILEAAARLLTWPIALAAAGMAADRIFFLPQAVRIALLGAGAAGFVWAAVRLLLPAFTKDWPRVFAEVARVFPELKDHLQSAWELQQKAPGHISEELRAEHIARTERLLEKLPTRPVFIWKPSLWARRGAFAAVFGGMAIPWASNGHSFQRLFAPWRDRPLELFVTIRPGTTTVDWGADVILEAQSRDGGGPKRARDITLWLREGEGGWKAAAWDRSHFDGARMTFRGVSRTMDYRMTWRDLESGIYTITPVAVPQWEDLSAKIHTPQGTETSAILSPSQPLEALRGSWITVTGRSNQELSKAVLRLSYGPPIPMARLASGGYRAGFVAREDATFSFSLTSVDGRSDARPPLYRLVTVIDEPPVVTLLSPLMELQASPADTIPITYAVEDDLGLTRTALEISYQGRRQEIPINAIPRSMTDFIGDHAWRLKGIAPGSIVEFRIKAWDNAVPPQTGVSQTGIVEIVDFESWHAGIEERWLKTEASLARLIEKQEAAQEYADRAAAGSEPSPDAEKFKDLPASWERFAKELSDLAAGMEQDAYANPGIAEQFKSLSEEMKGSSQEGLKSAMKAAKSGEWPLAKKRMTRLTRQLKAVQRLMRAGRKVQDIQDFHTQSNRMSQAGAGIEETLDRMAKGSGNPSPEELAVLNESLSGLRRQLDALKRLMASMPKLTPEQAAERQTYTLPVSAAAQAASALQAALARGDFREAARLAREMTQRLSEIQKALSEAAMDAAMPARQADRMGQVQILWEEAVRRQSEAIDETHGIEQARLANELEAQKRLLEELEARQALLIASATVKGRLPLPAAARTPMGKVLKEFKARRIVAAPGLLKSASSILRFNAIRRGAVHGPLEWFAWQEDDIRRLLANGPEDAHRSRLNRDFNKAAAKQDGASRTTAELHKQIEALADRTGLLPGPLERVEAAIAEQSSARLQLGSGRSEAGLRHQENALRILEEGKKEMEQAVQQQRQSESALRRPFERPGGGVRSRRTDASGRETDYVPLPTAKDYQPPVELRKELERSLKESRPGSYDGMIKEYFKRISQ